MEPDLEALARNAEASALVSMLCETMYDVARTHSHTATLQPGRLELA